jgi:UDP-GlcNAc:undecaprenyl-phosphate GlcNAc-1-phosphate transferase
MWMEYFSGFVALIFCLASLPIVRRLAQRFGLYDAAGPLKIHQGSIPRLGGIAMFAGLLAGSMTRNLAFSRMYSLPILVFAVIWGVGLVDDIRTLGSVFRFCIQISAGSALWFAGWRLEWFKSSPLDLAATCLFVAFLINAINLLDGMDGLAAGTAAIVCIGFLIISAGSGNALEIILASSLLGACIAMLFVNSPPATMFMGDSGSTLIGIVLAFLSLNWVRAQGEPRSIVIPLIFLCVPIADAILAILRRARTRQLLFHGDRRHFYDILLDRGWTVEDVLKLSIACTAILVLAGWLCAQGYFGAWPAGVIVVSSLAAGAYSLGSLRPDPTPVQACRKETPLGSALE